MKSYWRVFIDSNREFSALKVFAKLNEKLDLIVKNVCTEKYHKGGYVISFNVEHSNDLWADTVLHIISSAQNIGYGWTLLSSIQEEISIDSKQISLPGVTMVTCQCSKPHLLSST